MVFMVISINFGTICKKKKSILWSTHTLFIISTYVYNWVHVNGVPTHSALPQPQTGSSIHIHLFAKMVPFTTRISIYSETETHICMFNLKQGTNCTFNSFAHAKYNMGISIVPNAIFICL